MMLNAINTIVQIGWCWQQGRRIRKYAQRLSLGTNPTVKQLLSRRGQASSAAMVQIAVDFLPRQTQALLGDTRDEPPRGAVYQLCHLGRPHPTIYVGQTTLYKKSRTSFGGLYHRVDQHQKCLARFARGGKVRNDERSRMASLRISGFTVLMFLALAIVPV